MRRRLWVMFWCLAAVNAGADEVVIRYEKGPDVYEIALLKLALDHTVDEGPFRLEDQGLDLAEDRAILSLDRGLFDVTFMVLTRQ